ncbi:MAG: RdgB/HAM1 family non-canonical purine NTP pyrophosphatase [Gemmatales bacterium]|nr:RdgB/HAM1 family non-canonical purine NTP pyrophosphatase [Gemmatales bacterium]MDW8387141.1 RdgB/HAM1 family non-canonical purine NTP pyrophosphatase [Gemmatales bacterium]
MQPVLVLGTRNRKKSEELRGLLSDLPITIRDLTDYPEAPEVVEDGGSFEANGRKKASELAKALSQWVLSDDSGLVVPALHGEPGVNSAVYAGKHGDDEANNDKLLQRMQNVPDELRQAYYVCVLVLANPQGEVIGVTEGRCHGWITRERRGKGGFGYDPLFLIPEYHRTFGELSLTVKQALSHRARAVAQMRPILRRNLLPSPDGSTG